MENARPMDRRYCKISGLMVSGGIWTHEILQNTLVSDKREGYG